VQEEEAPDETGEINFFLSIVVPKKVIFVS
jgi:hypothetical protein